MKRILVVSDTHGRDANLRKLIMLGEYDLLIHLGDHDSDVDNVPIQSVCVRGNNDIFSEEPYERLLSIYGKKILMVHGHRYSVYQSLDRLVYRGMETGADIILFGHTHVPFKSIENKMMVLNPGSLDKPRSTSYGTYAVLEIGDDGLVNAALSRL